MFIPKGSTCVYHPSKPAISVVKLQLTGYAGIAEQFICEECRKAIKEACDKAFAEHRAIRRAEQMFGVNVPEG